MIRTDDVPARSRMLVTLVATAALAACGPGNPGTKGGSQAHTAPAAAITPIGYAPAADGTITVRSGALVVLSGKDSVTTDDPILGYQWTAPVDPTTNLAVPFLTPTSNSITFFAPNVPAGSLGTGFATVSMQVGLKITTASGLTSTANYTVNVVRASDEDDFLLSDVLATRDKVQVKIVAAAGGGGTALASDVPFTIHINRHVLYRLRGDVSGGAPAGDQVVESRDLAGQWLTDYGIVGGVDPANAAASLAAAQAAANPRFVLRPPVLSEVDVNLAAATATGAVPPSSVFDISAVNDAEAEYEVTLSLAPGAVTPNVPLALVALTRNGDGEQFLSAAVASAPGAPVTLLLPRSMILEATTLAGGGANKISVVEDASSALAYVSVLDPPGAPKDTLDKWMRDNCFDPAAGDFGGDIKAAYTNNFDLGFGRDMHFKTNCTDAQRSALGATINTAGGERAAVVVNYPSLESLARHVGGFLAVAMEYRVPPCQVSQGGNCPTTPIVSFWSFAQDPTSGVWKRVISADFDGRGQHYTPGNCTVCHGGRPKAAADYTSRNAELGAMFLPWDSKALLFADSDPSFMDDTLRPAYVKSAQMPNIRALNLAMADTLATDLTNCGADCTAINANRKILRDLATGWGNGTIDESYVPDGWATAASNQPPCGGSGQPPCVSPAQLYKDVIAQHCRACHLQRVAEPAVDGSLALADAPNFADYTYFTAAKTLDIIRDRVFVHGVMPASRLTSDRFWLGGTNSPASELANHIGLLDTKTTLGPVAQIAAIDNAGAALPLDPSGTVPVATPGTSVRLTARDSAFASVYDWALVAPPNSAPGAWPRLAGALDMEPGFVATTFGMYPVTLTVTDATGAQSAQSSLTIAVNSKPTAPVTLNSQLTLVNGVYTTTIDLLNPPAGNVAAATLGDGINIVSLTATPPGYATVSGTPGQSRACPTPSEARYDPACVAMCLNSDTSCALTISSPVTVTLNYQITDESPAPLQPDIAQGKVIAVNPVSFQAGSGSTTVAAWRPSAAKATLDLDNIPGLTGPHQEMLNAFGSIVDSAHWTYSLTITVAPSAQGRRGSFDANAITCGGGTSASASAAASGGVVTYWLPPYFVSNQGSGAGACNGGTPVTDSFSYTISAYDAGHNLAATSSEGTITLTVNTTATYTSVFTTVLKLNCATSSCHASQPPVGANWATASQLQSFLDAPPTLGAAPLGLASAGCPNIKPSLSGVTDSPTPHCIDIGDLSGAVESSLLYVKPQSPFATHGGGKVLDPSTNADLLQLIKDWLLDGAYNN